MGSVHLLVHHLIIINVSIIVSCSIHWRVYTHLSA